MEKGAFKGLAKIIGILSLWMSIGWALYPYLIEYIALEMGETIAMNEIWPFSIAMFVVCLVAGCALTAYGFIGKEVDVAPPPPPPPAEFHCPHCGQLVIAGSKVCSSCGKVLSG